MKVLCCGDRDWWDRITIQKRLKEFAADTVVIEGEARGADLMSASVAKEIGLTVLPFPADWEKFKKAAGPIRNCQMLDQKPDLVIAFHNDIESSKGTKHCVTEAKRRGIPVEIVTGPTL